MWLLVFTGMDNLLNVQDNYAQYVGRRKKLNGIPIDITFNEFERKIYRLTNIRRNKYHLTIKVRYLTKKKSI